jgi:hypothetical protein
MKSLSLTTSGKSQLFLALSFALLLICSLPLSAQTPPAPGYDLLQTGSGAAIDLSSVGLGNVSLQGVPIQTATGTSDTIMHRTQSITFGTPTHVDVTAIFMKSASSTTFMGQPVDVYVTYNNSGGLIPTTVVPQPDATTPSSGSVTVNNDGTFSSSITVNADVIFVKAGMPVTNSANYVGHQAATPITLTSSASTWTATPPSGYPSATTYPSGGFYPKPVHTGPHPVIPSTCNPPSPKQPVQQKTNSADTKTGNQAPAPAIATPAPIIACVSSVSVTQ